MLLQLSALLDVGGQLTALGHWIPLLEQALEVPLLPLSMLPSPPAAVLRPCCSRLGEKDPLFGSAIRAFLMTLTRKST